MATKVTDDGKVTVPKFVFQQLGIGPGSEVDFRFAADGNVIREKANGARPPSPFENLVGSAGPGPSTDELMELLRSAPE